jgi:hypothetical protein
MYIQVWSGYIQKAKGLLSGCYARGGGKGRRIRGMLGGCCRLVFMVGQRERETQLVQCFYSFAVTYFIAKLNWLNWMQRCHRCLASDKVVYVSERWIWKSAVGSFVSFKSLVRMSKTEGRNQHSVHSQIRMQELRDALRLCCVMYIHHFLHIARKLYLSVKHNLSPRRFVTWNVARCSSETLFPSLKQLDLSAQRVKRTAWRLISWNADWTDSWFRHTSKRMC